MDIKELMAALTANAERARKPTPVEVDGVGTLYVRRRTVAEFEAMAKMDGQERPGGVFGSNTADVLCDTDGKRFPAEVAEQIAALIAEQPDDVFRKVQAAANGKDIDAGN